MNKAILKSSICVLVVAMFFIPNVVLAFSNEDEHDYHRLRGINAVKENYENILQSFLKDRQGGLLNLILSKILSQTVNNKIIDSDDEGKTISCLDDVDQSQEQSDNFYKIYGTNWFAQSFTPTRGELTRVEIKISKHTKTLNPRMMALSSRVDVIERIRSVFMKNDLGSITVEIRDSLDGAEVTSRSLSPDEVPKNSDGHWVEFNVYDVELRVDSTYYIVVYANGGDDDNYYTWCFGDGNPYDAGMAYSSSNSGSSWDTKPNFDFCFRTYGTYTGDEPDGKVDRWAVIVGVNLVDDGSKVTWADEDAVDMKSVLIHRGWQEDHIKVLTGTEATKANIFQAFDWMDSMDDQDDIALFFISGHGGGGGFWTYDHSQVWGMHSWEHASYLDKLDSDGIAVIVSTCGAAAIIPYMEQDRRVILTACESDAPSGCTPELENCFFPYFLIDETGVCSKKHRFPTPVESNDGAFARKSCDINDDGWISAEEAFAYTREWTEEYCWIVYGWRQVPVISDNYDGELLIAQV